MKHSMKIIGEKVESLKSLKVQKESIDDSIKELENWLKSEMTERDTYELEGPGWKVSWNTVCSNKFNQALFRENNPDLFESYKEVSESRRFLLS